MLNILLNEDLWFPAAALIGLVATAVLIVKGWRRHVQGRVIAAAACSLFFGLLIGVLGIDHLFAVTTKALLGILPPGINLWFAIPFGVALAGPAWWLTLQVRSLLRADHVARKRALWLNAWLALVLASQGPAVVLAAPACAGIIHLLFSPRRPAECRIRSENGFSD